MILSIIFTALYFIKLVSAAAAPEVNDSPVNAMYAANFDHTIAGSIKFSTINGVVLVDVDLGNLPESGGPFMYHVHERPVPANGSCDGTLGHLNPYNGTLNAATPAEHEVGDLSGKHGTINGTFLHVSYMDSYLSLNPSDIAFIGNHSVVVHYANSTRLACANITTEGSIPYVGGAAKVADCVSCFWLLLIAYAAVAM